MGISLVILLLGASRGSRASLQKLHFLAHSIRTEDSRRQIVGMFAGRVRPQDVVVRFEPWLNRAIALASGAGLVEREKGKAAKLTLSGKQLLEALYKDGVLFREEKAFLQQIASFATEKAIDHAMKMELLF